MSVLDVLKSIWGHREGYVFLPTRKEKEWHEKGTSFQYPEEWDKIVAHIKTSAKEGHDVYWCPLVFRNRRRIKEEALPTCNILWADLDPVDPVTLDYRPSIAWKSSDDRYQALWLLDDDYNISEVEEVNKNMTYSIGADKGGWDVTQVLRVPGTPNFKYSPPQQGKLLWAESTKYDFKTLQKALESTDEGMAPGESIDSLIDGWEIPSRTRDLLFVDPMEVEVGDRSDRLWEIETSLLEAGMPVMRVVKIIAQCPWNKFKGRRDEFKQLFSEVTKADEHVKLREHKSKESEERLDPEAKTVEEEEWAVPFDKFMGERIEPPRWLIEDIWQLGSYGMMAGEPKTYKSVQAMDMALSVASGSPYLGKFPVKETGTVLYIQEENSKATIQDRSYKIAYHKGLITSTPFGITIPGDLPLYFCNNYGIDLTSKESRLLIEKTVANLKPILVILDPLYMMLGNADENSATEVRNTLRWLTYLRNQYGCAIMVIHHYNKAGSGAASTMRGGTRVRGTSQFHGWVESALYVKKPVEADTILIEREFRSAHTGGDVRVHVELGNPGELKYIPKVDSAPDLDDEVAEEIKKDEVCDALYGSSMSYGELLKKTGIGRYELTMTLRKLELDGIVSTVEGTKTGKKAKLYALVEHKATPSEEVEDDVEPIKADKYEEVEMIDDMEL